MPNFDINQITKKKRQRGKNAFCSINVKFTYGQHGAEPCSSAYENSCIDTAAAHGTLLASIINTGRHRMASRGPQFIAKKECSQHRPFTKTSQRACCLSYTVDPHTENFSCFPNVCSMYRQKHPADHHVAESGVPRG